MISKFKISTELRKLIINDTSLKSYVGNQVYPLIAPVNTVGSFITYYRDEYSKEYTKCGVYNEKCTVFFAIVSDDYETSQTIVELVSNLLEGNHTDSNGNRFIVELEDATEDIDDNNMKFIQIISFKIK